MKTDYSPEGVTRRLIMASELGRLCRSLRSAKARTATSTKNPPHLRRGLTVEQWRLYEQGDLETSNSGNRTRE
jgi:hypothetical protein